MIITWHGFASEGKACCEAAIRLNPIHPVWYLSFLGASHYCLRDYDNSVRAFEQAPEGLPEARAILAAAHAQLGNADMATAHIGRFTETFANHWMGTPSARRLVELFAIENESDAAHMFEGLRKAGLPE